MPSNTTCPVCLKPFVDDDAKVEVIAGSFYRRANAAQYAHESCAEDMEECGECGERCTSTRSIFDEDMDGWTDVCALCYQNAPSCSECGTSVLNMYGDYCRECDGSDWSVRCPGLQFTSTKARSVITRSLPLKATPYLGVELEYEFSDRRTRKDVAEYLPSGWWCYEDGSLDENGGEFVSPPTTYAAWRRRKASGWTRFLKELIQHGETHDGTGMHISISREAFAEQEHLLRFMLMVYRHPTLTCKVARRDVRSNSWCSLYDGGRERGTPALDHCRHKLAHGSEKYSAVNLTGQRVEVRIFKAPDSMNDLFAALGYIHALYEYTQKRTDLALMRGSLFTEYVKRHTRRFPELAGSL